MLIFEHKSYVRTKKYCEYAKENYIKGKCSKKLSLLAQHIDVTFLRCHKYPKVSNTMPVMTSRQSFTWESLSDSIGPLPVTHRIGTATVIAQWSYQKMMT